MKKLLLILTLITFTVITTQAQVISETDTVVLTRPLQIMLSKHTLKCTEQNIKDIQDINLRLDKFATRYYGGLTVNLLSAAVSLMGLGVFSNNASLGERNLGKGMIIIGGLGMTVGGVIMLTAPAQITQERLADAYDK